MTSPILQLKDIEAGYGKMKILKGINMNINQGDLAAIIGPNGSGKSTTLKTIFGLLKLRKGEVILKEKNIAGQTPDQVVRKGIAYVPQGRMVFQTMTVQENLEMGGFILENSGIIKERTKELYKLFPILKEKQNQKASFLSGGQQQMLSIARALILKPEVLLLDEPSLGLDPNMMLEIFNIIKRVNSTGTTIILVEQNARMALALANKVFVLMAGEIAFAGDKSESTIAKLKQIYFGNGTNGK